MIRGFYTSVSALNALQNEQETVTNNIANMRTVGFKKSILTKQSFKEVMLSNRQKRIGSKYVKQDLGTISLGTEIRDVDMVMTQGAFRTTNSTTDMAIDGRGFFVVQNANGQEVYTRDGNFKIDLEGYLITPSGDRVMGRNIASGQTEPIYVGNGNFSLDAENNINITGYGAVDRLLTADFDNEVYVDLNSQGDNYITNAVPNYDARVTVVQQVVENSNVDPTEELAKMMEIKRQFESNQKFVKIQDETMNKAATEIGRV